MDGSIFATGILSFLTRFRPTIKIRTDPTRDNAESAFSVMIGLIRPAIAVKNPWKTKMETAEKIAPFPSEHVMMQIVIISIIDFVIRIE